jgi:hypothetical protein
MVDVINLCRNISDGARPLIPPCSLASLYALTNMSYLSLLSSMFGMSSSNARNSLFTILCRLLFFLAAVNKNLVFVYPLSDCVLEKRLNILDVNCLPLSNIIFMCLPLIVIQSSNTLRTSTDLFLSDHLLATFLEQSSKQLMM